jgi:DNA-binding XRE family transcriptional regulator
MPKRSKSSARKPRVADEIMAGMRELQRMLDEGKTPKQMFSVRAIETPEPRLGDLLVRSLTEVRDGVREMAGHRKWEELIDRMSPQRRAQVDRRVRKELERMLLAELRRLPGMTQVQLAAALGIRQPTLSQLESQDDMQISTLRRIVEALGGDLEIIAKLPTGRVVISQFKTPAGKRRSA